MALMALLAASLTSAPMAAADKADLRCIAVYSVMMEQIPEEQAGMTGAIMFYIGRIEGRGSGLDLKAGLGLAFSELESDGKRLKAEAQRCGNEMVVKGEEVQRLGDSLVAGQAGPSGRN